MLRQCLCIVRCTGQKAAILLSVAGSFCAGFVLSRYAIDRRLAESSEILQRSAQTYAREQALVFEQWAKSYTQLERRTAALPQTREAARGR